MRAGRYLNRGREGVFGKPYSVMASTGRARLLAGDGGHRSGRQFLQSEPRFRKVATWAFSGWRDARPATGGFPSWTFHLGVTLILEQLAGARQGMRNGTLAQLFKADLLTLWFSLVGLFLVEVPKG